MTMRDIVIFDLDGTLAASDWRNHLVDGKQEKDWDEYYAGIPHDPVNVAELTVLRSLLMADNFHLMFLTGRPEKYRLSTVGWLMEKCYLGYRSYELRMRKNGDYRQDTIVKAEMLTEDELQRVLCVFEDRKRVVDMWRAKGVRCFQVQEGLY